ncbi:hypothetical protein RND71_041163 [Anisodus tanguticus]|uniref:Uncharacterized protein n=1 Tax=Anisodus tanguticus TaxID=243964 RepID=A0AAE1UU15_9SOLA|nr:hypothetical protein RND71_041163 [Anisodus tanguticus]
MMRQKQTEREKGRVPKQPSILTELINRDTADTFTALYKPNPPCENIGSRGKWTKPAGLLPKEIGSIFCNASCNKKPFQRDSSSSKNDRHDNAGALNECMEEQDQLIVSGGKGDMFKTWLEDSVERLTLSKPCSFKKILRITDTKAKPLDVNEENSEKSTGAGKQPHTLPRNLSGLFEFRFRKRIGFCFTNWKTNKADPETGFEGADYGAVNNAEKGEMSKTINWAPIKRQPAVYCIIRRVIHTRESGETRERMQT